MILAVPPVLASRLALLAGAAQGQGALLKALVPGSLTKAEAVYERPFWRDAGLSGQGAPTSAPRTRLRQLPARRRDRRALRVRRRVLDGVPAMAPADRRAPVLENLVAVVGEQARTPTDYFEQDWSKERWTRGCPVGHIAPGVLTPNGRAARADGEIHFAGTETADYWLGYMDGAVRSGERAAREVLAALRR